ncbi:hypothetical protein GCM10027291_11180 [Telluribacter humicola]
MAVALKQGDSLVLAEGFGYADLERQVRATPQTSFRVASITKTFTSTLLMQLVEQGKLRLDTPIAQYGLSFGDPRIQVQHLLTHTSEGAPGTYFHYNGYRYGRLGSIIQQAAGQPFYQLLMERIVHPLGMASTAPGISLAAYFPLVSQRPELKPYFEQAFSRLAKPYGLNAEGAVTPTEYLDEFGAFGGLATTVLDLVKYSEAIDRHQFVSAQTQKNIFTPNRTTAGQPTPYGLGWYVQNYKGLDYYWHYGQTTGESGLLVKVPARQVTLVVLANSDRLSQPFPIGDGDLFTSPVSQLLYKYWLNEDSGFKPVNYRLPVDQLQAQLTSPQNEPHRTFYAKEISSQASIALVQKDSLRAQQMFGLYQLLTDKPKPAKPTEKAVSVPDRKETQAGQSGAFMGTVTNASSGQPISNANVFVMETRKGVQTDRDGFFLITLKPGTYNIKVSYLGFKPLLREVVLKQGENRFTFQLEEDTRLLDEVTVTTGKPEENVQKVEIGASRLNIRSIQRIPAFMGEVDVMRSLLMLPGVTTVGEGTSGINVRGGSIDQNLVLMDDAPLFNTSHLFGFFSVFNQDAVRDVTLNRGGISSQYGGRASSVLDVRLKYPNSEKFTGSGGIGLVASRLALEGPIVNGKLSTLLAVRASFNDFLFKLGPASLRGTKANFYDITNKWYWKISERDELTLTGYYSDDNFKIPSDSLSNVEVNASSSLYGYRTRSGTLRWQHTLRDDETLEAVGVLSKYTASISIPDSSNALDLESGIMYANARVQYTNRSGERHKFLMGVSAISYGIQPNTLTPGPFSNVLPVDLERERAAEAALYLEDEWKLTEQMSVVAGLRYSHFLRLGNASVYRYSPDLPRSEDAVTEIEQYAAGEVVKSYGGFEPRLALRWTLNPATSVKMGYNRMIQYLHLISNTTSALPTARWATSSPYLRPQVADQVSIGLFRNLKNDTYETSAEVYYKKLQNAVDYKDGADIILNPALETAVLQGHGRAYGLEMMAKKNTGFWTGWVSYTYARTFLQIQGDFPEERINRGRWYPANYDRPHTLNAMAVYRPNVTTTLSFNFTFSSGRPGTFPKGRYVLYEPTIFGANVPIYTDRNQGRIPNYHRLDFSITFDEHPDRRWKGSWVFSIYNVYAHKNAFSVFYSIKPYSLASAYKLSIFGTIFPSLTYNFRF